MGGKNSTESGSRSFNRRPSFQDRSYSTEQSWNQAPSYQGYPPPTYPPPEQGNSQPYAYPPSQGYPPPPPQQQNSSANASRPPPRLDRKYSQIADNYRSLEQSFGGAHHFERSKF